MVNLQAKSWTWKHLNFIAYTGIFYTFFGGAERDLSREDEWNVECQGDYPVENPGVLASSHLSAQIICSFEGVEWTLIKLVIQQKFWTS